MHQRNNTNTEIVYLQRNHDHTLLKNSITRFPNDSRTTALFVVSTGKADAIGEASHLVSTNHMSFSSESIYLDSTRVASSRLQTKFNRGAMQQSNKPCQPRPVQL